MDFSFNDDQRALIELARQIFTDGATHQRMRLIERSGEPRFDPQLWQAVTAAGLAGLAVPTEHGGSGLGFLEVALVLERLGHAVAPVPLLETLVLGALPLTQFGSPAQQAAHLPGIASGQTIFTAAIQELAGDPVEPVTTARREGANWVLDGTKICIPAGQIAHRALIAARAAEAVHVFVVDLDAAGLERIALDTTSGQPEADFVLQGVRVSDAARLPADGREIVRWLVLRANAALASLAVGVCEAALELTAKYTKERKQFGLAIATFQAVVHREADAYIDTEAVRLTSRQAAWRIAEGLPVEVEVAVAKAWAADGGQRVVHAAQHLHGGVGADRDYPLHRYFLYARQLELALGGASQQYATLGRLIAAGGQGGDERPGVAL